LVDRTDPLWLPSVRVLAVRRNVVAGLDGPADLSFSGPFTPSGNAEISGTISVSRIPSLEDLLRVRTLTDLHIMIAPRLDLFANTGHYVGSAFATITQEDLRALQEALAREDADAIGGLLKGRVRPFRIAGLTAGRYVARFSAYGYPEREMRLELTTDRPANLDIRPDAL